MKPGIPWSVKGIESTAREAAKDAARRSGMTLGEWLNTVISEQAEGGDKESMAPRASRSPRYSAVDPLERATSKLEDIAEQLARLARRDAETSTGQTVYSAEARAQEGEQITRILGRIESNERQSLDAFSAVNERLGTLGRQFAQAAKAATTFKPEEHPSFQAMEKAVRNIVEHLEASEKRTRDNFKMMQDRLGDMASRAQAAPNDAVLRQAPAFTKLEQRLNDLSQRVEHTEKTPQALPDQLRGELQQLAKRIDTVRETAESLATRAQTQAVQTSQQELRSIEQRILGLLSETQQTFAKGSIGEADLQRIRADVEALNKRIDQVRQNPQTEREVQTLRSAVEQLSNRVAQGPDMRPIADMDRRIGELAQRLNEQQAAPPAAVIELEQRIVDLDQKLEFAMQNMSAQADQGLSEQLVAVGERLDRAESQLSHLGTIERAITQLYEGLEQQRNNSQQVAEEAANRVAHQILSQMPAPSGAVPTQELHALEEGLQAVRDAAQSSDHRNQETLLALHETLEHIVSKLSELETATIGQRIAAAAVSPAPASPAMPSAAAGSPFAAAQPASHHHRDSTVFASDTLSTSAYDFAPEQEAPAPAPTPPEPEASHTTTVEQVAHDEPQLPHLRAPEATAASAEPAVADDFIAAARRAAQAAQGGKASGIPIPGSARAKKKESPSLIGSLLGKLKGSSTKAPRTVADELRVRPAAVTGEAIAAQPQKFRRVLLLAGIVLFGLAVAISYKQFGSVLRTNLPQKVSSLTAPFFGSEGTAPEAAVPETGKSDAAPLAAQETVAPEASPIAAADDILTASVAPPAEQLESIVSGQQPAAAVALPDQIGTQQLRADAAAGNPNAQFIIASRYMDGERTQRDFALAAEWYEKAAAAGLAPAQYRIATLYERGRGVERDVAKALAWYEKAAALGNMRSMHNSAVILAGTEIGKPDYKKAKTWFSLSANHGLKDSQYNLAVLFERGYTDKPDLAEALFWYLAAARQNDEQAQKRADALSVTLPAEMVQRVKDKLANWTPEKAPESANTVQMTESAWQDTAG